MKIAIVGAYPRDPDRITGGVEAVTLCLSEGLAQVPGVEVHVVVSDAGRAIGTFPQGDGVTVHSIGGARRFGNLLFQLPDRRRIARALRDLAPDVVHAHCALREALGSVGSGLPTVVTIHGILEREIGLETRITRRVRGHLRRRLLEHTLARISNVIVLSPSVAEYYARQLAGKRTWTIENPVQERFFEQQDDPDPQTVLFSGLLSPRKGVRNLLRAFRHARDEVPGARLRVAGLARTPEYDAAVRETVRRLSLEGSVELLGHLPPDVLAREYARAAFLVLVSRQETLPVAIQEAMATGRPVIASPVGGVPTLVRDGENGFLVAWGDPELLAAHMVKLLRDAALCARLGARGREIAEQRFTTGSVCRRTLDVYRDVIARHGKAS